MTESEREWAKNADEYNARLRSLLAFVGENGKTVDQCENHEPRFSFLKLKGELAHFFYFQNDNFLRLAPAGWDKLRQPLDEERIIRSIELSSTAVEMSKAQLCFAKWTLWVAGVSALAGAASAIVGIIALFT